MKKRDLIKHFHKHGCQFLPDGSRHEKWWNPNNRKVTSLPRDNEIKTHTCRGICKQLGIPIIEKK